MEYNSSQSPQIVDLTGSDEPPVNPLIRKESPRVRRRGAAGSKATPESVDDDGIEVVSIKQREPPSPLRKRRRRTSNAYSDDGLHVVEQKTLTPQERLRRVQEQHARGEVVSTPRHNMREPQPFPSFGAHHFVTGGLMAPQGFHPYLMPPLPQTPPYLSYRHNRFLNMAARGPMHMNLEENIINSTLEASMTDISNRKALDTSTLMVPPPPSEPSEGFTRSLATDAELVCVKCNQPLGKSKRSPSNLNAPDSDTPCSPKVFARGCGHAYCGDCTYAMKKPVVKKGEKACPVEKCKKVPARKLRMFREVFL